MALFFKNKRVTIDNRFQGNDNIAFEKVWKLVRPKIHKSARRAARNLLKQWVRTPSRYHGEDNCCFLKTIHSSDQLAQALVGYLCATPAYEKLYFEMKETFDNFSTVYEPILDDLINRIFDYLHTMDEDSYQKIATYLDQHWFANVTFKWQEGLVAVMKKVNQNLNPQERLYNKINLLLSFTRPNKKMECITDCTPLQEFRARESGNRLDDGWSLNESHPLVKHDREQCTQSIRDQIRCKIERPDCQPILSGTSGTTMDIVNIAINMGITDINALNKLPAIMNAYFHTVPPHWPIHSPIEVQRGAQVIMDHYGISSSSMSFFLTSPSQSLGDDDISSALAPTTDCYQSGAESSSNILPFLLMFGSLSFLILSVIKYTFNKKENEPQEQERQSPGARSPQTSSQ